MLITFFLTLEVSVEADSSSVGSWFLFLGLDLEASLGVVRGVEEEVDSFPECSVGVDWDLEVEESIALDLDFRADFD